MNEELAARAAAQSGLFLTADARDAGYDARDIAREIARHRWHRLRRGAYVSREQWQGASPAHRHLLLARAVQMQAGGPVALTHITGALALGVETWRPDLDTVHVTHLGTRSGRIEYGVNRHEGPLDWSACSAADGLLVGPPTSVIAGAMLLADHDRAVVLGDSALRQELTDPRRLRACADGWGNVPRSRALRWTIPRLDGRAASAGESLTRVRLRRWGLPAPELQYQIRDGDFLAYADFAWPDRWVVGEFDGRRKYQRDLGAHDDPGDVVFREKVREDRLRWLGWRVVRVTWSELFAFDAAAARFGQALGVRAA